MHIQMLTTAIWRQVKYLFSVEVWMGIGLRNGLIITWDFYPIKVQRMEYSVDFPVFNFCVFVWAVSLKMLLLS